MDLTQKIKEKKAEFQSSALDKVQDAMGRAIKNLQDSGIMDRALAKGDTALDFTLEDTRNNFANLSNILSTGPVVRPLVTGRTDCLVSDYCDGNRSIPSSPS